MPEVQVEEQVQFDEVLRVFDPETKQATRHLASGLADACGQRAGEDVDNALGNLAPFTVDSLFDGNRFPRLHRGHDGNRRAWYPGGE